MSWDISRITHNNLFSHKQVQYYSNTVIEWASEWLLVNANSAIFHGENKVIFNEMMMKSALYWIFIVLAHWNNSPRVDMSFHSDSEPTSLCSFSLLLHA